MKITVHAMSAIGKNNKKSRANARLEMRYVCICAKVNLTLYNYTIQVVNCQNNH